MVGHQKSNIVAYTRRRYEDVAFLNTLFATWNCLYETFIHLILLLPIMLLFRTSVLVGLVIVIPCVESMCCLNIVMSFIINVYIELFGLDGYNQNHKLLQLTFYYSRNKLCSKFTHLDLLPNFLKYCDV